MLVITFCDILVIPLIQTTTLPKGFTINQLDSLASYSKKLIITQAIQALLQTLKNGRLPTGQ